MSKNIFLANRKYKKRSKDYYDFLGTGYYWGEISKKRAIEFIKMARKNGYRKAVFELGREFPGMVEYILSYSRADWLFDMVDFTKTGRALDIGSGWGAISFSLSRHFKEVYSLDAIKERLEFQRVRAQQEKRRNIKFVRSDWLVMPFRDNSFDVVCANGVFEWIGLSDMSKNPGELQVKFLKEIDRVLKPDGKLYIGIENRFAFFLLLGARDHSGLPFTSLMPRIAADFVVRNFRNAEGGFDEEKRIEDKWRDYRTYTYSYWGYMKILERAGFAKNNKIFWSFTYNSPTESGPVDGESVKFLLELYRKHNFSVTMASKMATNYGASLPKSLLKYLTLLFSPSFLIYSNKGESSKTLLHNLSRMENSTSIFRKSGTHGLSSKVNFILLRDGKPKKLAKLARFEEYSKVMSQEEILFEKFNDVSVEKKQINGRTVFIEPFIEGGVLETYNEKDNINAVDWLLTFQSKTKAGNYRKGEFKRAASEYLLVLDHLNLSDGEKKRAEELFSRFVNISDGVKVQKVSEHGDFVKTNIIKSEKGLVVIDWEFFEKEGDNIFDFIFFLINNTLVEGMDKGFASCFTGEGNYSTHLKLIFNRYSREGSVKKEFLFNSVIYVILRALDRRINDKHFRNLDLSSWENILRKWLSIYKESRCWLLN